MILGAATGVENGLTGFQRLARYPGVAENDWDKTSVTD